MLSKVVDRATDALALAAGLARHMAWYVSYQIDRTARDDGPDGAAKRPSR